MKEEPTRSDQALSQTYWALQRKWNKPASFRPLLERNLGFFAMAAGDGERIVHLYRWDSYDDAKQRLGAIVTPERMEYFIAAREALLLRQENAYLDRAPVAELSPLWNDKRDWLPGQPAFTNVGNASELAVSERVLDFLPGGLLAYWDGFRKLNAATMDAFSHPFNRRLLCHRRQPSPHVRLSLAQELARG